MTFLNCGYTHSSGCSQVCVYRSFGGAGVDILLLAQRGKTAHGGGYGSRSPGFVPRSYGWDRGTLT
jgi:hypothetical protein